MPLYFYSAFKIRVQKRSAKTQCQNAVQKCTAKTQCKSAKRSAKRSAKTQKNALKHCINAIAMLPPGNPSSREPFLKGEAQYG